MTFAVWDAGIGRLAFSLSLIGEVAQADPIG
jgi:hypothetical protein